MDALSDEENDAYVDMWAEFRDTLDEWADTESLALVRHPSGAWYVRSVRRQVHPWVPPTIVGEPLGVTL